MTQKMITSARRLEGKLRDWARESNPMIGHHSANVEVRSAVAKQMQVDALRIADHIAALCDKPDELESYLIGYDLPNRTANMDAHGVIGISGAKRDAFDAALARRNDREGFRRGPDGRRERRTPDGAWQAY
jgi:hypothetical protein